MFWEPKEEFVTRQAMDRMDANCYVADEDIKLYFAKEWTLVIASLFGVVELNAKNVRIKGMSMFVINPDSYYY